MATNDETLGKPIELTTRVPVKQYDSSSSSRALVAGAEQLAKLGLQADQALAGQRLKDDLTNTVAAYENVQSYVTGQSQDIFTGDEDIDAEVRAMVGEMDDVREAVRQGVMLPELGKARLETALKKAKSRRPNYADQLNQVAGEALGFNVQGYATRKLFQPETEAKLSPQQKLRQKIVEESKMRLYKQGLGTTVFQLDDGVAVNMASKLEGVASRQQQALANVQLDKAQGEQFERLAGKAANQFTRATVDSQLIGFQAALQTAPTDPEQRAEWNRQNIPAAIGDLRRIRSNLRSNFLSAMELTYGEEAVANMDAAAIDRSLESSYARIDQMIEDFQDPVMLKQYQDALELDMIGVRTDAIGSNPNLRSYLGLFSADGRDTALLSTSVGGAITQQQIGTRIAKELDVYFGLSGDNATQDDRRTAKTSDLAYADIVGADSVDGALSSFGKFVENQNEAWFTADIGSPQEQVKAANAFAIRATENIQAIADGKIEPGKEAEALERTRNTIEAMLSVPAREQVIELPTTGALLQKINSKEAREAESKYGVDFSEQREELAIRLRRDVSDMRSIYRNVLRNNTQAEVGLGSNRQPVQLRPLQETSFLFSADTGVITAVPDRKGIRNRIDSLGVRQDGMTAGRVMDKYTAAAQAFNNSNSGYRTGVAGVFFNTYQEIAEEQGSVDVQDQRTAVRLAETGIMQDLGFVDPNLSADTASFMRAVQQDPEARPDEAAPLAHKLAYEWYRTPSMLGDAAGRGTLEDQADALSTMYQAGLLREYARQGKLRFK